jgi:hypothetical protein
MNGELCVVVIAKLRGRQALATRYVVLASIPASSWLSHHFSVRCEAMVRE